MCETKRIIKRIINEWDPIDLLHHAPDDEYHIAIDIIRELIKLTSNEHELSRAIYSIFVAFYNEDNFLKPKSESLEMARKIIASSK